MAHDPDDLTDSLYNELRKRAQAHLRRFPGQTLQPTELVNEVYLRLKANSLQQWESRSHFFHAAAQAMRYFLVDHARRKAAAVRGGGLQRVEITVTLPSYELPVAAEELLTLNAALTRLQEEHPEAAEIALLRYFTGLTVDEIATDLGISKATVERRWRLARAYLRAIQSENEVAA
ncbi:MAG TPA: ECF-type sigma factor [Haliangium sp.]|nr:ECF-type sigma factor [Haliangium sp.]